MSPVLLALVLTVAPAQGVAERLQVRLVTDEPEAVLALVDQHRRGETPMDADWERLWTSEGYVRLEAREKAMGRPFTREDFQRFVLSPELGARADALRTTLARWKAADLTAAAGRALAYLPKHTVLRATVYPSIKPRDNSFVFELRTRPAIFLYLDERTTPEQFLNTVAHELHHVGAVAGCTEEPEPPANAKDAVKRAYTARQWAGAFSEGLAMLAAAGGPDVDPHAASPADERARWDKDYARVDQDVPEVERFFRDVLSGALLDEKDQRERAAPFWGDAQGPWYTVGYRMGVTVERKLGRAAVIDGVCHPEHLMAAYNRAAPHDATRWSNGLLRLLRR